MHIDGRALIRVCLSVYSSDFACRFIKVLVANVFGWYPRVGEEGRWVIVVLLNQNDVRIGEEEARNNRANGRAEQCYLPRKYSRSIYYV